MKNDSAVLLLAAKQMDWKQIVLHEGVPCFNLHKDGRFCGRAQRWIGHCEGADHDFISLETLLRITLSQSATLQEDMERYRSALVKLNAAVADLSKSNPGFLGKLVLQDYAGWNEAMIATSKAITPAAKKV